LHHDVDREWLQTMTVPTQRLSEPCWEAPRSLVRDWSLPWPGKLRTGKLPLVHFAAFDPALFARHDASTAQARGLDWNASLSGSVPRWQGESFYGRWAARAALREGGLPCVAVGSGSAREPLWPAQTVGSITHIDGLAAAAAASSSSCRRIGLDLERLAIGDQQQALRGLVVDRGELRLLKSLSVDRLDLWVTIAFSAKEGFYKAAYPTVGRFFDFTAAQVVSVNPGAGRLLLEVVEPLDEIFVAGSRWLVDFDVFRDVVVLTAVLEEARLPAGNP
jgi:enterobactin synthetase component D